MPVLTRGFGHTVPTYTCRYPDHKSHGCGGILDFNGSGLVGFLNDTPKSISKKLLREKARQLRAGVEARAEKSALAASEFASKITLEPNDVVALFWPIGDEIDCLLLAENLRRIGHQICLPVVMDGDGLLQFRLWERDAQLVPAGFGTMGPSCDAEFIEPDLIVAPLLAFDDDGIRLGYGKGYYDRAIAQMGKTPFVVGLAFSAQEIDTIPAEDHDLPLDAIITELGVRGFDDRDKLV